MARPYSIAELAERATLTFDPNLPIQQYVRAADMLYLQAKVYLKEGDHQTAFVYLAKLAKLAIEYIPNKHPGWSAFPPESKKKFSKVQHDTLDALAKLKPVINTAYEEWRSKNKESENETISKIEQHSFKPNNNIQESNRPAIIERIARESLPSRKHSEYTSAQGATPLQYNSRLSDDDFSEPLVPTPTAQYIKFQQQENPQHESPQCQPSEFQKEKFQSSTPSVHSTWHDTKTVETTRPNFSSSIEMPQPHYSYPKLFQSRRTTPDVSYSAYPELRHERPTSGSSLSKMNAGPPRPPKVPLTTSGIPTEQRLKRLSDVRFTARTEGGNLLRQIDMNPNVVNEFVSLASWNTKNRLETCGVLMGTLSNNTFSVTHLLIPKQSATSDTCEITNEEEIVAFGEQFSEGLVMLGWIHTHPTQSCFMSSLDLHTHVTYQRWLPEAIAIVCAPNSEPSVGYFRLTSPPGIDIISNCKEMGTFHPHPDAHIYTDAEPKRSGHVRLTSSASFRIHDLR